MDPDPAIFVIDLQEANKNELQKVILVPDPAIFVIDLQEANKKRI
jgi:hypothetical protein